MTIKSFKFSEILKPNIGLIDSGPLSFNKLVNLWKDKSFVDQQIIVNFSKDKLFVKRQIICRRTNVLDRTERPHPYRCCQSNNL